MSTDITPQSPAAPRTASPDAPDDEILAFGLDPDELADEAPEPDSRITPDPPVEP